jgi:hypothetical protein
VADDSGNGDSKVNQPLANAQSWDPTQTDFVLILLCTVGIAIICGLVGLMFILVRRAAHPYAAQISTVAMFWGLASAGSIVYATVTQLAWAKQNLLDILSGYGDPQAVGPPLPWLTWGVLVAIYGLLLVWIRSQGRRGRADG